jgi:hypothetical protein
MGVGVVTFLDGDGQFDFLRGVPVKEAGEQQDRCRSGGEGRSNARKARLAAFWTASSASL